MRKLITIVALLLIGIGGIYFFNIVEKEVKTIAGVEPDRFVFENLCSNLNEPIEMEILPDGNILLIERRGALKLLNTASKKIEQVGKIEVYYATETGLLGLALDPDFDQNNWIYLFYTDPVRQSYQQVARFDFENGQLKKESEKILIEIPFDTTTCCHMGGSLEFGPDGHLFISTGDNTTPTNYAFDERPENTLYDAQRTAANTMDLRGKILRITPTPDGGYTIPEGNLFVKNDSTARPEIYIMGARNPFRISIDQKRGWLFWGDVGPNPGTYDPRRGPNTLEEFNLAKSAGNFGWPYFLGDNQAFMDFDFSKEEMKTLFDEKQPINDSPNNTGKNKLPAAQPALIWYPTEVSKTFPLLGSGGGSAMSGPVYHFDETLKNNIQFPKEFDKKLFIFDWMRSWIMAVELDENGTYVGMSHAFEKSPFIKPIQIKFGPDGAMYILDYGSNWYTQNPDAGITKVIYQTGNRKPVAVLKSEKFAGAVPFNFQADAHSSYDVDQADQLTYEWFIADELFGSGEKFQFNFDEIGIYDLTLKVSDQHGSTQTDSLIIYAGNATPEIDIMTNLDTDFYQISDTIHYQISVTDEEDGIIPPHAIKTELIALDEGQNLTALENTNLNQPKAKKVNFYPGEILIMESDCRACHAPNQKSVGPSWGDIATRYANNSESRPALATSIIKGGTGNWGEKMMSAHPQFSEAEAMEMVQFILSFDKPKADGSLDTVSIASSGRLNVETLGKTAGRYKIKASYTDQGANELPEVEGIMTKIIRPAKLLPHQFDVYHRVVQKKTKSGRSAVVGHNGAYIGLDNIQLKKNKPIHFRLRTNATKIKVEARLGSASGKLIGRAEQKFPEVYPYPSMDDVDWFDLKLNLRKTIPASSDVYFVFYTNKDQSKRTFHSIAELQFIQL